MTDDGQSPLISTAAEPPSLTPFTPTAIGIFSAGLILRLALLTFLPLYPSDGFLPGYNDEPLHLHYVEYIASGSGLPVWKQSSDSLAYLTDEYVQPPTYYFLSAPFYRFGDLIHRNGGLYGARLMSVICGMLMGLFVYRTAWIWSKNQRIALGALIAVMFSPNAVVFTSLVTNDALVMCISSLFFYYLVRCRMGECNAVQRLFVGLLLGVAVWSKLSAVVLFPMVCFVRNADILDGTARTRMSGLPVNLWMARLKTAIIAGLVVSPLIIWNIIQYGEPIPGQTSPLSTAYWPEEALGISGGAVFHPIAAVKFWLRLTANPFDSIWGSPLEKVVSLLWVLIWGTLTVYGIYLMLRRRPMESMFVMAIIWALIGFIWHNVHLFQVEFRLSAPVFGVLAIIAAKGADAIRMPFMVQALLWCLPILLIPWY